MLPHLFIGRHAGSVSQRGFAIRSTFGKASRTGLAFVLLAVASCSGEDAKQPEISIEESSDAADPTAVAVTGTGFEPEAPLILAICRGTKSTRTYNDCDVASLTRIDADDSGSFKMSVALTAAIAQDGDRFDCRSAGACKIVVSLSDGRVSLAEAELQYDSLAIRTGDHEGLEIAVTVRKYEYGVSEAVVDVEITGAPANSDLIIGPCRLVTDQPETPESCDPIVVATIAANDQGKALTSYRYPLVFIPLDGKRADCWIPPPTCQLGAATIPGLTHRGRSEPIRFEPPPE